MADVYYLPGALEGRMKAREAATRRRTKVCQRDTPLPRPRGVTPLDGSGSGPRRISARSAAC
jgi:hypothetical protein